MSDKNKMSTFDMAKSAINIYTGGGSSNVGLIVGAIAVVGVAGLGLWWWSTHKTPATIWFKGQVIDSGIGTIKPTTSAAEWIKGHTITTVGIIKTTGSSAEWIKGQVISGLIISRTTISAVWIKGQVISSIGIIKIPEGPPLANFRASIMLGDAPLWVLFEDISTGTITNRSWDFGDGSTSTEKNPLHLYGSPGSYLVYLTVTNQKGSNTASPKLITVTTPTPPPPPPQCPSWGEYMDGIFGIGNWYNLPYEFQSNYYIAYVASLQIGCSPH